MTCGECNRGQDYSPSAVVCRLPEKVPIWAREQIACVLRLRSEDATDCPCFERKEDK